MRPRRPKQYCLQLNIALWCKNQIEHCIWDESLLLCHCACSLEYFSLSTLAGLSYHICGKLKVAFKASPSSQHQHCTDEAETIMSAVIYVYIYIYTPVSKNVVGDNNECQLSTATIRHSATSRLSHDALPWKSPGDQVGLLYRLLEKKKITF